MPNGWVRRFPDPRNELEAVHLRHTKVDDENVRFHFRDVFRCQRGRVERGHLRTGGLQHDAEERQGILFVVDGGDVNPCEVTKLRQRRSLLGPWMFPWRVPGLGMNNHHRQAHAESGSLAFARARRIYGAAMHFDDVANNRKTEPEAAGFAGRARLRLPEPLEYVREEIGLDSDARVADHDFDVGAYAPEPHLHAAVPRRELHRIRHEVPDHLLQSARIAGHRSYVRVHYRLNAHALGVGGRLNGGHRVVHDDRQLHRLHVEANFP